MDRSVLRSVCAWLLGLLVAWPAVASSCIDYSTSDPEGAFDRSDLVFSGEVISVETVSLPIRLFTKEGEVFVPHQIMARKGIVTFRVERDWKNVAPQTYAILANLPTEVSAADDRIVLDSRESFVMGKRYLVFASGYYPEANFCAPTKKIEPGDPFVRRLDRHAASKQQVPPPAN